MHSDDREGQETADYGNADGRARPSATTHGRAAEGLCVVVDTPRSRSARGRRGQGSSTAPGYACARHEERLRLGQMSKTPSRRQSQNGRICLDLFSGAGGFSEGFRQAGFHTIAATDIDASAGSTYQLNHEKHGTKFVLGDISDVR